MDNQELLIENARSDHEIISMILLGKKDLFSVLVRRYNQRLYRICLSIMNNDSEVEDIMQSAYILAYENLAKFKFQASFSTWLTRILINESLRQLRSKGKLHLLKDTPTNEKIFDQRLKSWETPLSRTMNTELKQILEHSIQNLPDKYRTVFVMREIEGMNVAETQECLDISASNVKVRLNRAKLLLRDSLSSYYQKEDLLHFDLKRCERVVNHVMRRI